MPHDQRADQAERGHELGAILERILGVGTIRILSNDNTDPLLVMKWRDILDSLETATDRAEDVANILEGIVLEHA